MCSVFLLYTDARLSDTDAALFVNHHLVAVLYFSHSECYYIPFGLAVMHVGLLYLLGRFNLNN